MIRTWQHRTLRPQARRHRACLAATALALLISGCSIPGKIGSFFGRPNPYEPQRTANYQPVPIDEDPPKKIQDPVALKLRYARWMEEIKNYPEAVAQYKVVLEESPEEVDALLGLARIDQAANKKVAAEAGYKKAVELSPDSAAAKHALGEFYASQERWQEALPLLNEATLSDPTNKSYRFNLAVALASSGDTKAAFPHFQQSVGDVIAHYNLGMILQSQGKYRLAEQQFLKSLEQNPRFEEARQALAEVRQLAQSSGIYAARPTAAPQIQTAGHSLQVPASRQTVQAPVQQVNVPAQQVHVPAQQAVHSTLPPMQIQPRPGHAPTQLVQRPAQQVPTQQQQAYPPVQQAMPVQTPAQPTLTPRQQEQLRNQRMLQY